MNFINKVVHQKSIPFIKKWDLIKLFLGVVDILAIMLAYQCSYFINYYYSANYFFHSERLLKLFLLIAPLWLIILYFIKIAEIPRTKRYRLLFFEYLQSAILIIIVLLVFYFVFKLHEISRLFLIEFSLLGFLFLFFVRLLEYKAFKFYRAKGHNYVNIVLIADDSSLPFIDSLISNKDWGYRIIAIFAGSPKLKEKHEKTSILIPGEYISILHDLMEVDIIDEVLYIKGKVIPSEIRSVIRSCEELGVVFRLKYKDNEINLTNAIKTKIGNEKFLNFINIPYNVYSLAIKRIMDVNVSFFAVILLSPFFSIIAALIKFTSSGPIMYKQVRVGLRGRQFNLYKFRTMVVNADELKKDLEADNEVDGPVFKMKDDPRITKIGKLLRKTGLDELPQLFNILKGEMSLIGPRPPIPEETLKYKRWQLRRLSVKPGLSCFWQIKPDRNSIKFEKWMEMDLAYIDNWSLRLDFLILLKTAKTVFQRSGL